jgi:hypothetical protein
MLDDLAHLLSEKEMITGAKLRKMLGEIPEVPSTVPQATQMPLGSIHPAKGRADATESTPAD